MSNEKKILIIAGPNGAGKTTFAREFLPNEANCPVFVNADLIAAGLSPFQPEVAAVRAGRIMMQQIHEYVRREMSFAFETTLSGRTYARMIPSWQAAGYRVELIFLGLSTVDIAVARVAARVAQGGHAVPEDVIRRRFIVGRRNFDHLYVSLVDYWALYDNAGETPRLINLRRETMKRPAAHQENAHSAGIEAALYRSARQARELGEKTGTPVYVLKDGKIINPTQKEDLQTHEKGNVPDGI